MKTAGGNQVNEVKNPKRRRFFHGDGYSFNGIGNTKDPVAIIGMSGIMPASDDLTIFWNNLVEGKDMISEIPKDRWSWEEYYGDPNNEVNKTNIKWGGFMNEVDKFDSLFFGISPREAELMDPQQRIFLEIVYKTIENAGYKVSDLSGSNTGLYVGVGGWDYNELLDESKTPVQAQTATGITHSILANRISYLLNLHGPSEPVDTACSSSLVAVYHAVASIQNGNCEMAIAGGVNVLASPKLFISFNKSGMLAEDGRCKTFDKDANGYVRGEGAGAVLLKPLSKAIEDGDYIYGVIKGTAVNHGGRANSLTAPNPNAQAQLVMKAWKEASVDPQTISYIETHGTGTSLGDPVEVNGLKLAFDKLFENKGKTRTKDAYCGLGAVKTNIGHLETAAGIAGLIKVLLAIKHGKIPGNLHMKQLNPYIELQGSPFFIENENRDWLKYQDANGRDIPRRAGISSFGFGGVNAHIAIEEYELPDVANEKEHLGEQIFIISAKNDERLLTFTKKIHQYITDNILNEKQNISLQDFAYTLQVGKDAMDERLAVIATNAFELHEKLGLYISGKKDINKLFRGNIKGSNNDGYQMILQGNEGEQYIEIIAKNRNFEKIAKLWVTGIEIKWDIIYRGIRPKRIPLPTYPFERIRHWKPETVKEKSASTQVNLGANLSQNAKLHPIVDENVSNFKDQKFNTEIFGHEFYIKDHIVNKDKILPGTTYLEISRACGEIASEDKVRFIRNVLWVKPIAIIDEHVAVQVCTRLHYTESGADFEVSSTSSNDPSSLAFVNAKGSLVFGERLKNKTLDAHSQLDAIKARCNEAKSAQEYYQIFDEIGFNYGSDFKAITSLRSNDSEALSYIILPERIKNTNTDLELHPVILDAALQTIIPLVISKSKKLHLPFALGELEIHEPIPGNFYSYVKIKSQVSGIMRFDVLLFDDEGRLLVSIKDFSAREIRDLSKLAEKPEKNLYYSPVWRKNASEELAQNLASDERILVFAGGDVSKVDIEKSWTNVVVVRAGDSFREFTDDSYELNPGNMEHYSELIKTLTKKGSMPAKIVFLWSNDETNTQSLETQVELGFYSLFYLSQLILKKNIKQKFNIIYLNANMDGIITPTYAALGGFAKSLAQENPKISIRVVTILPDAKISISSMFNVAISELKIPHNNQFEVMYDKTNRMVREYQEITNLDANKEAIDLKEGSVYLITGGAGGLGLIFAKYLWDTARAKLVLTGRSTLNTKKLEELDSLRAEGAEIEYIEADISNPDHVTNLIDKTIERFGQVNGIIHCAGVTKDSFVLKKTSSEIEAVISPKVYGTTLLDAATKNEKLDFFILFSSVAGAIGNMGQSDYSFANSFMDYFAIKREQLRHKEMRNGRTISINWPLWKSGGMSVDKQTEDLIEKLLGFAPLETDHGINGFKRVITLKEAQVVVATGNKIKINEKLGVENSTIEKPSVISNEKTPNALDLKRQVIKDLVTISSELLKVDEAEIDVEEELDNYGLDSILMMDMMNRIEQKYGGSMEPNALAEYNTIQTLAGYLIEEGIVKQKEIKLEHPETPEINTAATNSRRNRFEAVRSLENNNYKLPQISENRSAKVAIVGVACRFPESPNLETFWENLKSGKDMVTQVPSDRWKITDYYSSDRKAKNKSYSKWGGFIEDPYSFDANFFGISDMDAYIMDPHHRILLELTQELLCRTGFTKADFSNTNTSVYIGSGDSTYVKSNWDKIPEESTKHLIVSMIQNMMAARISDYYNLKGSSLTIDTACSSSLVAIHQACKSIINGESDMAIAGGIELLIDQNPFIGFSKGEVLSPDGKCYVFDEKANGIVLSEGAGLVLLKSYEEAVKAGDPILGVVSGSAVNNDGHTMGLTVPSLDGQKDVIEKAIKASGITPSEITYLEAHGTGTLLGDPIEIQAASQVYQKYTNKNQYCAVASVKSNMGHSLRAAGVAGFIKAVLAMQNKYIPMTINCLSPHPRFKFEASPFFPAAQGRHWKPEGEKRIAAISSFGFGGTNCHMILEEFTSSHQHGYALIRNPLPITNFKRKYYRLGEEIIEQENSEIVEDENLMMTLLEDLKAGKIDLESTYEFLDKIN